MTQWQSQAQPHSFPHVLPCMLQDIARYETVMLSTIQQPSICLHFLRPGRLVRIREGHLDWGWGIVVSVMRKAVAVNAAIDTEDMGPASAYVLDLLLSCDATSVKGQSQHLVTHQVPVWLDSKLTNTSNRFSAQFDAKMNAIALQHRPVALLAVSCCTCTPWLSSVPSLDIP